MPGVLEARTVDGVMLTASLPSRSPNGPSTLVMRGPHRSLGIMAGSIRSTQSTEERELIERSDIRPALAGKEIIESAWTHWTVWTGACSTSSYAVPRVWPQPSRHGPDEPSEAA